MAHIPDSLNVVAQCRHYRVGLWLCPQFLFIIMGFVIVVAMTVTFMVASRYSGDPFVAVGSVAAVTTIFFTIFPDFIQTFWI